MSTDSNKLFNHLISIVTEVSQGKTSNVNTIFELTKASVYPQEIVNLAESFGMMIVNIEAKQQHLEKLMSDLQEKNRALEEVSGNLLNANIGMLEVLGNAVAKRDSDTSDHNYRVTTHSIYLGRALGLSKSALCSLIKGAFLHDIGKIAISDSILLKPGKLTDQEFDVIKTHVHHGSEIIKSYPWLADANDVVFHHHEKFNGNGYPGKLKGEEIPLNARIFAIIDVFDALTSKRPYKEPYPFDTAIEIMTAEVGSHFDPMIFELFLREARELHEVISDFHEPELVLILHSLMYDYFALLRE